jgi:hypothetical protein
MTAINTDVLGRIVVNDDPAQSARAAEFLRQQDRFFPAKTVCSKWSGCFGVRTAAGGAKPLPSSAVSSLWETPKWKIKRRLPKLYSGMKRDGF